MGSALTARVVQNMGGAAHLALIAMAIAVVGSREMAYVRTVSVVRNMDTVDRRQNIAPVVQLLILLLLPSVLLFQLLLLLPLRPAKKDQE